MHAISSYRGNRLTNKQTDRTDYNTLRRWLVRCVIRNAHLLMTKQHGGVIGICTSENVKKWNWLRF